MFGLDLQDCLDLQPADSKNEPGRFQELDPVLQDLPEFSLERAPPEGAVRPYCRSRILTSMSLAEASRVTSCEVSVLPKW